MAPRSKENNEEIRNTQRQKILTTALKAFSKYGLHGVKMADIADEAEVSYGLIYHYYSSKEKLFSELVHQAYESSLNLFQSSGNTGETPDAQIRYIIDSLLSSSFQGDGTLYFQIVQQALTLESVPEKINQLNKEYVPKFFSLLEKIITSGQQQQLFSGGNPRGIATAFLALIFGLPFMYLKTDGKPELPSREVIFRLFNIKDSQAGQVI